jgi:tetraacyldisaccharide 4'-kinase
LLIADGREEPLESLRGHPLAAFCGIGNPAGFRHTLTQCGYNVTKFREFPDHFAYPPQDIAQLSAWVTEQKVEGAVCTHKDLVKIAATEIGGKPLRAVLVGMEFINRQDAFEAMIAAIVSEKLPDREK